MLTPSSNTVLESIITAMVDSHARGFYPYQTLRVTKILLSQNALQQFDTPALVQAAQLLADAKVDVIVWNGASAGGLGLEADHHRCEQITASTSISSTTSVLAMLEVLAAQQMTKIGVA